MRIDLLLHNADIITMDDDRPRASSLGVLNGTIVGLDDDLDGVRPDEVIDAKGATVVPGFNDVHCHTTWFGLTLSSIDLTDVPTIAALYETLTASADRSDDEWITATGFNHHTYGGQYPSLLELDRITGSRPLFIRQTSGHAGIANTEALRRAGALEPGRADPEGGVIERDNTGQPTGVLHEQAQALVQDLIRPYSLERIADALDLATRYYAKEGITSFTEAGIGYGWIGHSRVEIAAYQRALESGRLHARAQLMVSIDGLHAVPAHVDDDFGIGLDLGMRTGFGNDRLSLGPLKIFLDGALSSQNAALTTPYEGSPDNKGYLQGSEDSMRTAILDAYRSGWSVAAHAIGDHAVDIALDVLAEAQQRYGLRATPNRIEHAAMVRPENLPAFAANGIVPVPQPGFFQAIGDSMKVVLGPERATWTYRGKSFLDTGAILPGSSDRPCADGNPLRSIQAAVDRRTGTDDIFVPEESITAAQSLRAYTLGSAEATGTAAVKGKLARGYLADLVLLSESPTAVATEQIAQIEVLATLLGGELTHDAR